MSDMVKQTGEVLKEIKAAAEPKTVDILRGVEAFVKRIEQMAPRPPSISPEVQIVLEEMRQRHEIEMKRIEMEMANVQHLNQCHLFEMREAAEARMKQTQMVDSFTGEAIKLGIALVEAFKPAPKKRRFPFFWR